MEKYAYLYGMIMCSNSYLLAGDFPAPDSYAEIKEKRRHLGGETGTAAAVLMSLGVAVKPAGSHYGNLSGELITSYFTERGADVSELVHEDFDGIEDSVFIDKSSRTSFGEFGKLYSRETPFYEPAKENSIANAACVGLDPFFGDEPARFCVKHGKPYAVIDCDYDSYFNINCAVNAVSHEYLDTRYAGISYEELFRRYTGATNGLVIFTLGKDGAMYGRKGRQPKRCEAFPVNVISTLGAGDSFKAGTIYGLYKGLGDDELVKYACAVAGTACTKFPIAENPPTLPEVEALVKTR